MGDALHLHFSDLKKHGWGIFYLAVVSVALSITAGASLSFFNLFEGLTIGAYVSLFAINMATDAVSVQSVLSRFKGIKHDIKGPPLALVFKIQNDREAGPLCFLRVYLKVWL